MKNIILTSTKSDKMMDQFILSLIAGGIAFFGDISSLYFLTEFIHLHYLLSATIAFIIGVIINYYLSKKYIFSKNRFNNKYAEFIIFVIIGIIGLLINNLIIWFFTEVLVIYYMISKCLATFFTYIWNFITRKFILFNN